MYQLTLELLYFGQFFIDLKICNSLEKEKQIRPNYYFADPPVAPPNQRYECAYGIHRGLSW